LEVSKLTTKNNIIQKSLMEEVIEKYCDTYAKDLEERLCLQKDKLTTAMAISTLLNPIFGLRPRIVGCGLMSDRQYD
jgi:hypothetical protein